MSGHAGDPVGQGVQAIDHEPRASLRRADFSERAITALADAGLSVGDARLFVLAVERFTIGYVLEEQSPQPDDDGRRPTPEELTRRFPNVTRAVVDYSRAGAPPTTCSTTS